MEVITFRLSLTRATATLPDDTTLFFLLILLDPSDGVFLTFALDESLNETVNGAATSLGGSLRATDRPGESANRQQWQQERREQQQEEHFEPTAVAATGPRLPQGGKLLFFPLSLSP